MHVWTSSRKTTKVLMINAVTYLKKLTAQNIIEYIKKVKWNIPLLKDRGWGPMYASPVWGRCLLYITVWKCQVCYSFTSHISWVVNYRKSASNTIHLPHFNSQCVFSCSSGFCCCCCWFFQLEFKARKCTTYEYSFTSKG